MDYDVAFNGLSLKTCVTTTAMNSKCTGSNRPLIFFHTDSFYYCRNQPDITPYCSYGVLKATKTISSNSFNYYRCLTSG